MALLLIMVFVTATCTDPCDLDAQEKYFLDERTLRKLKGQIWKMRIIVQRVARSGYTDNRVLKELELISKKLFISLKEEKETFKNWPFSAQSRISNITKELEHSYECVLQLCQDPLRPSVITYGGHQEVENQEPPMKKQCLEEQSTTSHEENGGTDTNNKTQS